MFSQITDIGKKYFSTDDDWNNKEGETICVWEGCILPIEEKNDFISFLKDECEAVANPIGHFKENSGIINLVFTLSDIGKFSIWRFGTPGLRWFYDKFSEINGGVVIKDEDVQEFLKVLDMLGLKNDK